MYKLLSALLIAMLVHPDPGGTVATGAVVAVGTAVATAAHPHTSGRPATRKHHRSKHAPHLPIPDKQDPNYRNAGRYDATAPIQNVNLPAPVLSRPVDLTVLKRRLVARPPRVTSSTLAVAATGVQQWWTYEQRSIPGLGQAMMNVGSQNLLVQANDVDVQLGGLDLAFRRTYNSQSKHDANNEDGSTPSVFGNRWTNNFDAHLSAVASIVPNTDVVTYYSGDGEIDRFSCTINASAACSSMTPGFNDILATTNVTGGVACSVQLTKKAGPSYIFNAPYAACGKLPGEYGRLQSIYGRNLQFYVTLAYSWNPDAGSANNLTRIVVTHQPDGAQLQLQFSKLAGSNITELTSMVRPDLEAIDYLYASNGDLTGVDKPGSNPIVVDETIPTQWPNGQNIPQGNLPEMYSYDSNDNLSEACGGRASIALLNGNPGDGACVDFAYNGSAFDQWWTRGVLNPTPRDGLASPTPSPIQAAQSTAFTTWDSVSFVPFVTSDCSGPMTAVEMTDDYGHDVLWCYDSSDRVIETMNAVSSTSDLTSYQSWDAQNNLVSTTDPRGNTTNTAYDANGNILEISLPQQATSVGSVRATSLYDYDTLGNIIRYCDPANNPNNAWNPNPGSTPCLSSGGAYAKYTYSADQHYDANEPYGCITDVQTPLGYHSSITYGTSGGTCGLGLPRKVAGDTYDQVVGQRSPTQSFTYDLAGALQTYDAGNGAWTMVYTTDGMHRLQSRSDPDAVSSYLCYYPDGTTLYSETALQHQLDGSPSCPSIGQIFGGQWQFPAYAPGMQYDADKDLATVTSHHGCTTTACPSNQTAATGCNKNPNIIVGTTCNFYDGLDRLVETKRPHDSSFDLYTNPWVMRYWYALTGAQVSFGGQTFDAHGNLFKTQELLPPGNGQVTLPTVTQLNPSSVANGIYQDVTGTAFDGSDRAVVKYTWVNVSGTETLESETLTFDTSPLDANVAGLLGEDCNSATPQQCKEFDYRADRSEKTFASSDGSSPTRTYLYDPDGRVTKITSVAYNNPEVYTYDADGRLSTSLDASGDASGDKMSPATLTHNTIPMALRRVWTFPQPRSHKVGYLSIPIARTLVSRNKMLTMGASDLLQPTGPRH